MNWGKRMKMEEFKIMKSVLGRELGGLWPLLLAGCWISKIAIFHNTHWANLKTRESKFAKRLSISAAIYLNLMNKYGKQRAFEIVKGILVPIGLNEQLNNLNSLELSDKNGMERLLAFYDFMGKGGVGQFVKRKIVQKDRQTLHYEVRDCFFARFYGETGTPELTKLFCEVDREFFPRAFPDFRFHRGSSFENTVAHGKDHRVFIFEK
jgi:hypothetical protein